MNITKKNYLNIKFQVIKRKKMNAEEEYDNDDFVEEAYSEETKEINARRANVPKNEHLDKEVEKVTRK